MVRHLQIFILCLYLAVYWISTEKGAFCWPKPALLVSSYNIVFTSSYCFAIFLCEFFLPWYRIKRSYIPFWRSLASTVQRHLWFYFYRDIPLDMLYGLCFLLKWLAECLSGSLPVWWLEVKSVIMCFSPLRNTSCVVRFMAGFRALTLPFLLCLILCCCRLCCHQFFPLTIWVLYQ